MRDDHWKSIMRSAVRACINDERITSANGTQLFNSLNVPIKDVEPFDLFTVYLFKQANKGG